MSILSITIIFLAAVSYMVLGFLWYNPRVFGTQWLRLFAPHVQTRAEMAKMQRDAHPAYIGSFASAIVMSAMLWIAIGLMGIHQVSSVLLLATLIWVGFIATITFSNSLFNKQPFQLWLINAGYNYVGLLLMSVILVKWG